MLHLRVIAFVILLCSGQAFAEIRAYFSPSLEPSNKIIATISQAKSEILVLAYAFTDESIADALSVASERGVRVAVVFDYKFNFNSKFSVHKSLSEHKVAVFFDKAHPIAHNKVMIIDRKILITGSYNYTMGARKNGENLLVISNEPALIRQYILNFTNHLSHSVKN